MKRNTKLFDQIADAIEKDPKRFDQEAYCDETECGTSYCVAGWAAHLSGYAPATMDSNSLWKRPSDKETIDIACLATELLGLSDFESIGLFSCDWTPTNATQHNVPDALRDIGRGGDI